MEHTTSIQHGGEAKPLDTTGLCLLSLDGGGVRGLSTLYILKSIMDRLNHELQKDPPMKPCELFDLIGGTNTGGLIAIMLGRLEMSVDECIAAYSELATDVFGEKLHRIPVGINGKVQPRFNSATLESAIQKVVTQGGASKSALFNDGKERGCRTFVCSIDHDTKHIVRLRSYALPDEQNVPATVCEAALATSATTAFFKPVTIGNRAFADGRLGANNPVDEVEGEASNIWCPQNTDLKPLVKCFISIGTGSPGLKPFEDSFLKFLSQTVVQIATETEETEKKFIARWARAYDEKRYFRFNVEHGLGDIGLEEYKKKGAIEAASELYMSHTDRKFRVRDCIRNLQLKQNINTANISYTIEEYNMQRIAEHRTRESPQKALWIVPFQENPKFVGRTPEINKISALLANDSRCERVAVVGLGGVGKTQIALEFAHQWRRKYSDCAVFWIPVTNLENMLEAYLEVGRQLQIPDIEKEKAQVQKLVQQRLDQESTGRWLLVIDNADDIDMWTEKTDSSTKSSRRIDCLPKGKHGSILFTTRSREAATKLASKNVISVREMDNATAKELLRRSLNNPDLLDDGQATKELLSKLTHLPLAIAQAAAYINVNEISLQEYAALLDVNEENTIEMLSKEFEDEGRYEATNNAVAATWLISFQQIQTRNPLAAEYLSFMSCVDPKNIPKSLLPPAQLAVHAVDAIGTLSAYSFVNKHETGQLIDLHRLVHLATRNWLRMENSLGEWAAKALERLEEVLPDDDPSNRTLWRLYLPHARYALEAEVNESNDKRMSLLWKFASCTYSDGRYNESEKALAQMVD